MRVAGSSRMTNIEFEGGEGPQSPYDTILPTAGIDPFDDEHCIAEPSNRATIIY